MPSHNVKNLGTIFDRNLTFNDQINKLCFYFRYNMQLLQLYIVWFAGIWNRKVTESSKRRRYRIGLYGSPNRTHQPLSNGYILHWLYRLHLGSNLRPLIILTFQAIHGWEFTLYKYKMHYYYYKRDLFRSPKMFWNRWICFNPKQHIRTNSQTSTPDKILYVVIKWVLIISACTHYWFNWIVRFDFADRCASLPIVAWPRWESKQRPLG